MCGRYAQSKSWRAYQRYLRAVRAVGPIEDRPSWNVAPSTTSLVVRTVRDDLIFDRLRWGIAGLSGLITNARIETCAEKPAFRDLWRTARAIVPIEGWYEWRTQGAIKQPFYFVPRTDGPVLLVALQRDDCFTLVTSETNGPLREVHTRRPVAISAERAEDWCDQSRAWSTEELTEALIPEESFQRIPVGPAVNSSRNDGPQLIEPAELQKTSHEQISLGF